MSGEPEQGCQPQNWRVAVGDFASSISRSLMCFRLVPAWLGIHCLCSNQSQTGLLKSSGEGNPPKSFTPLFGEVAKFRTLTKTEEQ